MSDKLGRKKSGEMPVSAHPAFPVIVALWFAALLGIGSMVLPTALFERFAVASGLADVYAAARPPLGMTARIGVALAAAVTGALLGVFVARKVAAANAPAPVSRRASALRSADQAAPAAAKRPIFAHEELGEGGLDADQEPAAAAPREPIAGRRRALSVTDDSARSDFLEFAPLPGQQAATDEPLDLMAFEAPEQPTEPPPQFSQPAAFGSAGLSAPVLTEAQASGEGLDPTAVETTGVETAGIARQAEPATPQGTDVPIFDATHQGLDALGMVELVDRFAKALQNHRREAAAAPTAAAEPELSPFNGAVGQAPFAAAPFAEPLLSEAREPSAVPAALRTVMIDEDAEEDDGLPDLDLTAMFSRSRAAPEPEPPRPAALTAFDPEAEDDAESEEAEADESGYTSLLAMKSPAGLPREPVLIDDEEGEEGAIEPVVVFPGQMVRQAPSCPEGQAGATDTMRPFDAPLKRAEQAASLRPTAAPSSRVADPAETERALRAALETLQRMSGAA